jgi:hypothetical protein
MRRISSSQTFFHKRVFPIIWFGFIGFFLVIAAPAVARNQAPVMALLLPIVLLGFGYFLMRSLVFDLMDEVYLHGDGIIVRNKGEEDCFPVTNILNVDASTMTKPERITLTLRKPCRFGSDITFSPTFRFWPFSRHPIALELIQLAHGVTPKEACRN